MRGSREPFKSQKGVTLAELLVVIFIIALMSGSFFVAMGQGRTNSNLKKVTQEMSANLRSVQTRALAGTMLPFGCVSPNCSQGFGLYVFSATQYYLFYNLDTQKAYNGSSVITDTITLPAGMTMDNVGSSIYFVPPAPKTYINGVNSGNITLTFTVSTSGKSVLIDSNGKIDIE